MWRLGMFWRLFILYGVLLLLALGVLGALIVGRVEQHYEHQIEDDLRARALLIRDLVQGQSPESVPPLQERVEAIGRELATRITLLDVNGRVLAESERDPAAIENHADRPEIQEATEKRFGTASRFSRTIGQPLRYVALRTDDPAGSVAYVRVALPLTRTHERLAELRWLVWSAAAVAALAGTALTFWLARRITRPVEELTRGAERLAAGGYGHKVYAGGRDEAAVLARTFNHMSERLAAQFAQLEEDRQQLRAILSGMVEGVIALDAEQHILFANDRAAQLLDFQAPAVVGRKLWEVVRQRSLQELVQRALAGPEACQEELSWNGPGSRNVLVHAARLPAPPLSPNPSPPRGEGEPFSPLSPPRGEGVGVRGAVLVFHDMSELRRLERVRQEFVANVSHELKTPLAVIRACVETLLDGA